MHRESKHKHWLPVSAQNRYAHLVKIMARPSSMFRDLEDNIMDSPSFNKRELYSLKENPMFHTEYDSPSTIAADLSENVHIESLKKTTCPKKPFFDENDSMDFSPSINKVLQPPRPPLTSMSSAASSTWSLASSVDSDLELPSRSSASLFSKCNFSIHRDSSTDSVTMPPPPPPRRLKRNSLRRANTITANSISLGGPIPSPIMERASPNTCKLLQDIKEPGSVELSPDRGIRSKFRRTHSMYQSPKEVYDNTIPDSISSKIDKLRFEESTPQDGEYRCNSVLAKSNIKHSKGEEDLVPRIEVDELVNILDGSYKHVFDQLIVIDCRFEYEFNGGHIDGAINISSKQDLEEKLLSAHGRKHKKSHPLLIFHCEFSSYRGPIMANHLRKIDRLVNQDRYPSLDYPDMLILNGGYKTFFNFYKHRCFPKHYVEMKDHNYKKDCERELHRIRSEVKCPARRKAFVKSKSFHSRSGFSSKPRSPFKDSPKESPKGKDIFSFFGKSPSASASTPSFQNFMDNDQDFDFGTNNLSNFLKKPPNAINFGFKFPKPKNAAEEFPLHESKPLEKHNDTPILSTKIKKLRPSTLKSFSQPNFSL